nr:MAG TPA: hypothetical protein [Caudoviricetes sp.]
MSTLFWDICFKFFIMSLLNWDITNIIYLADNTLGGGY